MSRMFLILAVLFTLGSLSGCILVDHHHGGHFSPGKIKKHH